MNAVAKQIPAGYRENAAGHLVPEDAIQEIDIARDDLVMEIIRSAEDVRATLAAFKGGAMGDIEAFVELSAEKYGATLGGLRGNITLTSFDGRYKIQVAVSDRLVFDERLQAAKTLIDECIHRWTEGSNANIKALIEHAFQTDKEGKINTGRVLGLTRLNIEDAGWKQAMTALRDSIQVASTSTYLRLYHRDGLGKYQQISLDLSAV